MRIMLAAMVALMAAGAADRAQAIDYPWCAEYTGNWGASTNCGFNTQEQCMATVRGVGGYCRPNGAYVPAAVEYDRRMSRKRKRVD